MNAVCMEHALLVVRYGTERQHHVLWCSTAQAMEQQTISIAKAGITTMLKSRTSVLAAANPPSGKYDDLKTAQENIDLQTTILSRFDLIFIVKDERSVRRPAISIVLEVGAHCALDCHHLGVRASIAADCPSQDRLSFSDFSHGMLTSLGVVAGRSGHDDRQARAEHPPHRRQRARTGRR